MNSIGLYPAIKKMRELSDQNIPFAISFVSCNMTKGESSGVKRVKKAVLRTGLSQDKGVKSESLVGYTDLETGKHKWFYLPLLLSFNKYEVV